jgi:hypothetical protein
VADLVGHAEENAAGLAGHAESVEASAVGLVGHAAPAQWVIVPHAVKERHWESAAGRVVRAPQWANVPRVGQWEIAPRVGHDQIVRLAHLLVS